MRPLLTLLLPLVIAAGADGGDPAPEALESELEERVEVQFVLLDVVVVDRKGRARADVSREDFEVLVDGREVEIASLDLYCPQGESEDARADWKPGRRSAPARPDTAGPPGAPGRRIALVFDYFHMDRVRAFEGALDALDRWGDGSDEHMIVSLGGALKVELPFTRDLDLVRATLERMYRDPSLYAGNHSHLTEWRFFDRVERLFDVLEPFDGRKVIVMFSGPNQQDGFYHDRAYTRLAARSAVARTAVYPVDTSGMRRGRLGGPEQLRRLAVETGGRMTADTNDLALAYGRARRDLGCTYTIGFHDREPKLDRERRVVIWARKKQAGLRVVHPAFYVVRSADRKRRSLARTAELAPEMFSANELNARLVAVGPRDGRRWEAQVAVDIDAGLIDVASPDEPWTLRAFLRKPNGTVVRSFTWKIPDDRLEIERDEGRVVVAETISARPGVYRVSAVLSGPGSLEPFAAWGDTELPAIPAASESESTP